jgi:hypothetical protein
MISLTRKQKAPRMKQNFQHLWLKHRSAPGNRQLLPAQSASVICHVSEHGTKQFQENQGAGLHTL